MSRSHSQARLVTDHDPELYPHLDTLTPALVYQFIPVARTPEQPQIVHVKPPNDGTEPVAFYGALCMWNGLWEAGSLRSSILSDQRRAFPGSLRWLFDQQRAVDIRLVPRTVSGYAEYQPLYHLLPLSTIEKFGLPSLEGHCWPTVPQWIDDELAPAVDPRDFRRRLERAFASAVWQLLNPRTPTKAFSDRHSPVLLAHNLDFWMPHVEQLLRDRARTFGRCEYDKDEPGQAKEHARLRHRHQTDSFSAERPLRSGSFWCGEVEADGALRDLVETADRRGALRAIFEAFRSHRLEDDFSAVWSWEREDFERRLYRKRDKVRVTFVEVDEDTPVIGPDADIRERLLWSDFFSVLDPKERTIAVCLRKGATQVEIARRLGYSNHTAVSKALKRIRAKAAALLG